MSEKENSNKDPISVRLARSAEEIEAAQRLRYAVFYEEHGAKADAKMAAAKRDFDDYDEYADHLIVIDHENNDEIVGTYRLIRQSGADKIGQFYSADEYNLTPLLESGYSLLELGRSCVVERHRTRPVLQLLWQGIADYIGEHEIELMFGCASLHGTDIKSISKPLSYLHHYHLAPELLRPRAVKGRYINMNIIPQDEIDARRTFAELPPLIKGYLRTGARIGDGAVVDEQFNTTDVCIVAQTHLLADRYRRHYDLKIGEDGAAEQRTPTKTVDNVTAFKKKTS